MRDRVVRVVVGEREVALAGPLAELVALMACLPLSPRTVGMLRRLVAAEPALVALTYARIEVEMTPGRAKLYWRKTFDRQSIGEWDQEEDHDAA